MAEATTIAPAAPAAAPTAPTAPAAPSTPPAPSKSFSDLDSRASAKPAKAAPTAPAPTPAPEKGKAAPAAKPEDTPPAADKSKPTDGPKQLREQYEKVNGELSEARSRIAQFESKIKDYEAKGKDTTALSEKLAAIEKEKEELASQIRALKREASPEFKKQYDEPFQDAAEFTKRRIEQLQLNEGDADNPKMRNAKWEDFVELYNMPFAKAGALAKQLFGEMAPAVLQHISDLQRLDFQRAQALKKEQDRWAETERNETARATQEREYIGKTWRTVNDDIANSRPEWYQEDPKDPEGNELLKEGFALVDAQPNSIQEKIVKDANVRLKAAAFNRLAYKLTQALATIEERDATIAEMKGSKPGPTQRGSGDNTPAPAKKWQEELRETMSAS